MRLTVRLRVRFLLFYSKLTPTDPRCNMLHDFTWTEKYQEAMSDEHPLSREHEYFFIRQVLALLRYNFLYLLITYVSFCDNEFCPLYFPQPRGSFFFFHYTKLLCDTLLNLPLLYQSNQCMR